MAEDKFARPEFERRFLLAAVPADLRVTRVRHIADRYIDGTTLRLRHLRDSDGAVQFKLTKKMAARGDGPFQGRITTIYLTEEEHGVFRKLAGRTLAKTRLSAPPFGIDVFEDDLKGLVMAEAEFASAEDAAALVLPAYVLREVTGDKRFTGGRLSTAVKHEVAAWLAEFGIKLDPE